MKSLLLVVDPISTGHSVQFELFSSMVGHLSKDFDVTIASIFLSIDKFDKLSDMGVTPISLATKPLRFCRLLRLIDRDNESMLWMESWLREGLLKRNSAEFTRLNRHLHFDFVVNATNTVPIEADIWWTQGPPLLTTLKEMAANNPIAKVASVLGHSLIRGIDVRIRNDITRKSKKIVANSRYSSDVYESLGIKVDGVVYSTKDFSQFRPETSSPSRDFVLTYIGKETDIKPIMTAAARGVRIVGFGSKLPLGVRKEAISTIIDFKGKVTESELKELYYNALFTMFPFTNEPFGFIPLESMACGTPVLTYKKQGPAETVLHGITGWLVESQLEIVNRALNIWKAGRTDIDERFCLRRASEFSPANTARQFERLLNGS